MYASPHRLSPQAHGLRRATRHGRPRAKTSRTRAIAHGARHVDFELRSVSCALISRRITGGGLGHDLARATCANAEEDSGMNLSKWTSTVGFAGIVAISVAGCVVENSGPPPGPMYKYPTVNDFAIAAAAVECNAAVTAACHS